MNDNDSPEQPFAYSTGKWSDITPYEIVIRECEQLKKHIAFLEQMVRWASQGRCMGCGWLMDMGEKNICKLGYCSYQPEQQHPTYEGWHQRMKILEELK